MDSAASISIQSSNAGDDDFNSLNLQPPPPPHHHPFVYHLSNQPPIPLDPAPPPPSATRASKKRSRASRRPPTTVLTTDLANFRAMVQEFTGVPSPPFAATPSRSTRPRLDLFPPSPRKLHFPSSFAHLFPSTSTSNHQTLANMQSPFSSMLQSRTTMFDPTARPPSAPTYVGQFDHGLMGSVDGDRDHLGINGCRLNYAVPRPRDLGSEKAPESAPRSEAVVDSWILSSE